MAFDYIPLWDRYRELFESLQFEDIGRLVVAMQDYKDGREPKIEGNERFVWPFVRRDIDNARAAYEETCRRQSENGAKGGRPKKSVVSEGGPGKQAVYEETQKTHCFSEKPKKAKDKDNVKDNVNNNPPNGGCNARTGRFTPPTLAEVQSYVAERHSQVDPQGFIDFYESKGWMVGKTPMKDWKAACRNAEKWDRWQKTSNSGRNRSSNKMAGMDFQPSEERIRKNQEFLEKFFKENGIEPFEEREDKHG